MPNDTEGEMGVESKGYKLRVIASGLCMAAVMLVSVFTGEFPIRGNVRGLLKFRLNRIMNFHL